MVGRVAVVPSLGAMVLLHILAVVNIFRSPAWVRALISILSVPLYWVVKNTLDGHTTEVEARRHDAVLVPVYKGRLPGNLDALTRSVSAGTFRIPADISSVD